MINIFTPNDNASGYAHGVITPGFIWAIVIVSFVFLSALALFLWYIHYYKKANTSKNKTYILKIEDMDESQKKDQYIVNHISWTKYNWKDLWGFYYEIKFTR